MAEQQERPKGRGRAIGRGRTAPPLPSGQSIVQGRGPPPQSPVPLSQEPPHPQTPAVRAQVQPSTSELPAGGRGSRRAIQPTDEPGSTLTGAVRTLAISTPAESGAAAVGRGSMRGGRELVCTVRTKPPSVESCKKGCHGTPVKFQSNYFKVITHPDWTLHQYRVDFKPEEDRTPVRKALMRPHQSVLGGYLFDGTMLFSTKKLSPDPLELCSKRSSDDANVIISIRWVANLMRGDYQYLQFFNILTRKCLEHLKLQLVGRDYYDPAAKIDITQFKLELWPGYVTSIRQHETQILLCAEISHKVMRMESVLGFYMDCSNKNPQDYQKIFQNAIIGTVVLTSYNNKTYRVDDVDFSQTPMNTFDLKGTQTTYVDYYKNRYALQIADRRQPLLISRPKPRDIRAGQTGIIILIPELCRLTGLNDSMRNNFQLMKALGEYTRVGPEGRVAKLQNFSKRLRETPAIQEDLRLWGMKFSPDLIELGGRVLPPEKIVQKTSRGAVSSYEIGKDADWTKNLRGNHMLNGAELASWGVIFDGRSKREVLNFIDILTKAMSNLGFSLKPPHLQEMRGDRVADYANAIEQSISAVCPSILLIVVANNRAERYAAIKKKCYVDRCIPSQVVTLSKMSSQGVMSIATKIGIQMCCKIGGSPWSVELPLKMVMVVGYDVCHDSHSKAKSYGAMVASINSDLSRYYSIVSHHSCGEELSNNIAMNLLKALEVFKKYNGQLPSRIIFYRDGVGEGQIPFVYEVEVKCILEELKKIYPDEPKLSFVIVSKRLNTRFFLNGRNPPPGSIVDDVVTLPDRYDFFLVSQSVRQGTVSPTNYNVIYDTSGLTPDKMQRITYKMTHLYYNWSGTVRVPAQCQYAHKLAYLVGQSIHQNPNPNLNELLYYL